jgi:diadenosine tetraphosphate (Ap4A) HIT family hydrolase
MNAVQQCPFCYPSLEDTVLLETDEAKVICDAKPAVVGHVLIVSREHSPSAFDLSSSARAHLRLAQQEIGRRTRNRFGEVGIYEHGRSMLCRFQPGSQGHFHAHLHAVPISFDLIARSQYESSWTGSLLPKSLAADDRYLYQEIGDFPQETWATGRLPVVRHFVRSELQNVLTERGLKSIPLSAPPDDHDDAIDQTAALLSPSDSRCKQGLVLIASNRHWLQGLARGLRASVRLPIANMESVVHLVAQLSSESEGANCMLLFDKIVEAFRTGEAFFEPDVSSSLEQSRIRLNGRIWTEEPYASSLTNHLEQLASSDSLPAFLTRVATTVLGRGPAIILSRTKLDISVDIPQFVFAESESIQLVSGWNDFRFCIDDLTSDEAVGLVESALELDF